MTSSLAEMIAAGLSSRLTAAQLRKCAEYLEKSCRRYNSYQRLPGILKARLPRDVFFACLGDEWSSCDNIAEFGGILTAELADATRRQLDLMMSDQELGEWKKLPATIVAYRFAYADNLFGFSYSLKREVAESFSTYHRYTQEGNDKKYVVTARIPKRYAVLKLDRQEEEIILTRPKKAVHVVKTPV